MHSSPSATGGGTGAIATPPSKAGRQRSRSEHRGDEPSSSSGGALTRALFEQLQADHISEQKEQQQAFMAKMQEWTTEYVSKGEQKVLGKMGKLLENFESALEPRFCAQEEELATFKVRLATLEADTSTARQQAVALAQAVHAAETNTIVETIAAQRDLAFDRPGRPDILRVNSTVPLELDSIVEGLADIARGANIDPSKLVASPAGKDGKRATISFKEGTSGWKASAVNQIFEYYRNDGEWRAFNCKGRDGVLVRSYMDRDFGPRQEKMEALARKMVYVVKTKYPRLAAEISLDKREGKVKVAYQPLFKIVAMPGDASYYEVVKETAARHGIDLDTIKTAWSERAATDSAVYERG